MKSPTLKHTDLNLLPLLKALLIEKNISRAARKMGLSQPAMSRAFSKLKLDFDDPLMVRTANQYQLTPRAQILLQQLNQLLPQLDNLWHSDDILPEQIDQTFVVSGTDMDIIFISKQMNRLQQLAPKLHLAVRTSSPRVIDEVLNANVDLALTAFEDQRAGLYRKQVAEESFVVVAGEKCAVKKNQLDLDTYLAMRHGKFSFAEKTRGRVDSALEQLGLTRNVVLSLPTFLQIPSFLTDPQLLFSVPQSFADYLASHFNVKVLPLPFETKPLSIYLYWHERQHTNKTHRWLREQLLASSAQ